MEPKPGFFDFMSRFTRPSDTITDKQVEILLDAPGVRFPPEIKDKFRFFIKKQWATREGKKSAFELFKEASHPCSHEFFYKLINGAPTDEGDMAKGLPELYEEKKAAIRELDPNNKQFIEDSMKGIDIQFSELAKFFTEGIFLHLENNLLFRKGKPIAVKEGAQRDRMQQCHAKLTEDDYEQSSRRFGPDEEGEGVAGKAFEGQGRTRKHRRKGKKNKTKARKMRSRR
jgi:hypothetical protein